MGLTFILCWILQIYSYVLLARVILSFIPLFKPDWHPPAGLRPIVDLVYGLTEPPLQAIRRLIPQPAGFPLDVAFIVLYFIVGVILPRLICR